jgi:hypothetical protein
LVRRGDIVDTIEPQEGNEKETKATVGGYIEEKLRIRGILGM